MQDCEMLQEGDTGVATGEEASSIARRMVGAGRKATMGCCNVTPVNDARLRDVARGRHRRCNRGGSVARHRVGAGRKGCNGTLQDHAVNGLP